MRMLKSATIVSVLLVFSTLGNAQTADQMADITKSDDDAQRQANNQHDWWLVSTTNHGRNMHRFYVDREKMTSMEAFSRAWVDHYWMLSTKLMHNKILVEADCSDRAPRINFRMVVDYGDGRSTPQTRRGNDWRDVIPGSSQETQWRFICHGIPANAIVYVPDAPEADAKRHFAAAR